MAPLHVAAAFALSATAVAQTLSQTTWAAVVFTFHGEKYPSLNSGPYNLTPLGATQLYDAGSVVRDRYVTAPTNASQTTLSEPIHGISANAIDNTQLYVLSTSDEYVSGSALAFMQGLYPPTGANGAPFIDAEAILSNESVVVYPLNGYQYPNIGTVSTLDFNYIWIAGNVGCSAYSLFEEEILLSAATVDQVIATAGFYKSLASTVFGDFDASTINYSEAWDLYEYALYQYNHNNTVLNSLSQDDLTRLYLLASQQQFDINTPDANTTVSAMAGQTFASIVLQQFHHNIASAGVDDKLTLLFGSFEPFISFFALSNLDTSSSSQQFNTVPLHGSTMTFELFSESTNSTQFPSTDELYVRFLFRNGTGETEALISYPLFGRGNSEVDMTWADFVQGMGDFSLNDVGKWCTACNTDSMFCQAIELDTTTNSSSNSANPPSKKTMSPVVAGVIGSAITLAVVIFLAVILGVFVFSRDSRERRARGASAADVGGSGIGVLRRTASGGAGGFKGAEKLASDTDLRLKGGAGASVIRHERVGSWELNENARDMKHSSLDKQIESGRVVSHADYGRESEDGLGNVNPFGDPVKALDQV